jgi:transcriptional antiterminator RfaH
MKHIMEELFKTNRWYLLSTKSRSEKTAYDNLKNQGYETFLPTLAHTNKPKALFPGYIFVKPRLGASYVSINSTRGVKQFIKFGNIFPSISKDLIEFLRTRIEHFETLAMHQNKYQKGQIVYVKNGPFKDFEAIFDAYDKDQNVFILLEFLERTQKIKLREADLN